MVPTRVTCYRAPHTVCDVDEIADWLDDRVTASVDVRDRFLDVHHADAYVDVFARARVHSPTDPATGSNMYGIRRYEERVLADPERSGGVLYDGITVQRGLNAAIPAGERSLDHLHVAFLDRVIGTWGDHDGRWHKRVAVLGQPALISVPGLTEAPAKPEAYYKHKQQSAMLTGDTPPREVLEGALKEGFLREDDPRTTEALKGYALAAVHVLATGQAFCDVEHCRLANPHRHGGVIEAQLREPQFCPKHTAEYA